MKRAFSDITILIDIDDTIIDLLRAWCNWLNFFHNLNVIADDITDWNIVKFFPTLTAEEVFSPLHNESFWKTVKPKDNASKYVKKLIDDGFNIYLCTSTDYRNIYPKFEFIVKKYFPFIPWKQVIVINRKQMVKADFLIDDGIHNHRGGDYIKILMSAPHNRNYEEEKDDMIRVEDWSSVYDIIINYSKKIIGVK